MKKTKMETQEKTNTENYDETHTIDTCIEDEDLCLKCQHCGAEYYKPHYETKEECKTCTPEVRKNCKYHYDGEWCEGCSLRDDDESCFKHCKNFEQDFEYEEKMCSFATHHIIACENGVIIHCKDCEAFEPMRKEMINKFNSATTKTLCDNLTWEEANKKGRCTYCKDLNECYALFKKTGGIGELSELLECVCTCTCENCQGNPDCKELRRTK
jgi:hypothetical protein